VNEKENLLAVAHRRLYPSIFEPNYLVLRSRRRIFTGWIERLGKDLAVLDVGGRYQPYRPLLEGRLRHYVAVDILPTALVDVLASGQALPFAPNTFDLVIATQVFEYFPQPHEAARQIYAALKPGGCLLMSAAGFTPRVVDEEHWRFTPAGLRVLLASFSEVEIVPEVPSPAGLLRSINLFFDWFLPTLPLKKLYAVSAGCMLNLVGLAVEYLRISRNDQFTTNFSIFAKK
jgi:SAM-dependent methyltransferase